MKQLCLFLFCAFSLFTSCASGEKNAAAPGDGGNNESVNPTTKNANPTASNMKIKIGNSTFTATLYDNATAAAFKALLPMTVNMVELNGNEKYVDLSSSLPASAANPGTIHSGDVMLYGSKTVVLFYKTFATSYNYTKLGRVTDAKGLEAALGSGNVTVTFELEK